MRSYVLSCIRCNREVVPDPSLGVCPHCSQSPVEPSLLEVHYCEPPPPVPARPDRGAGVWAFAALLPSRNIRQPVTLGEGHTPLIPADRLRQHLKMDALWMKNEATNPTGSFKDRMAAVAVSRALADGHDGLLVVSSGNMGSAVATYSARAHLPVTVVVSSSACPDRVAQFKLTGARVVTLDGPGPVKMAAAAQLARSEGLLNVTAPFNSFALEGVRTVGYEIWTELGELPDWVVVPVGYGSLVTGLFGAFQDILAAGVSRSMPRLAAVQSTGSPSLVRAFERGLEAATPGPADSVCSGINQEVTIASVQVLRALRASRGTAGAVPDADILAALELLARTEGILVEPTGAAAIAGLLALRRDGIIGPGEVVVAVLTGTGIRGKTWGRQSEMSGGR